MWVFTEIADWFDKTRADNEKWIDSELQPWVATTLVRRQSLVSKRWNMDSVGYALRLEQIHDHGCCGIRGRAAPGRWRPGRRMGIWQGRTSPAHGRRPGTSRSTLRHSWHSGIG